MIKKRTFDSIYHEHYSYFTLKSLDFLFKNHGLTIFDAQKIKNHGGSLRIFVKRKENNKKIITQRYRNLLKNEEIFQLQKRSSYNDFVLHCNNFKNKFTHYLNGIKKENKHIIGITSPAKGVVLLNYCKISGKTIDFIVDSTPFKQYKFMPGTHIPIMPENELEKKQVDYFLILAWTYKKALLEKLEKYRKNGTKIIIPLPTMKVI